MSILLPRYISKATTILASHGRGGDDRIVHLKKEHANFLKAQGGSGTINPHTGLREYINPLAIAGMLGGSSLIAGSLDGDKDIRRSVLEREERFKREAQERRRRERGDFVSNYATAADLSPQELFERAQHVLASDSGRFARSQSAYPKYPGPRLAAMSPLTQRANSLEAAWGAQPKPQAGRIAAVGARPNVGISPENIRGARENMNASNRAFGQNVGVGGLKYQFGPQYNSRNAENLVGTEIEGLGGKFGDELNYASGIAAGREGRLNDNMLRVLQNMQKAGISRQGALTGSLRALGTQQQAHGNMVNDANKQEFMRQERAPYDNMERLESTLAAYQNNGTFADSAHPDSAKAAGHELAQALRAYGIDPNSHTSTWTDPALRKTTPGYTGQLVAPESPETVAAQSMLHRMEPSFKNDNTPERKRLMEELMGRSSVGDEALSKTAHATEGTMSSLNPEGSRVFSNAMAKLSNKYLRLGQFNSPQHIAEAEELARSATQASGQDRAGIFGSGFKGELNNATSRITGNQDRVASLADQEHNEWNMAHNDIGQLNARGMDKWKSAQNENEDIYKNYIGESGWAWPSVRGAIRRQEADKAQSTISGLQSRFNDQAGAHSQEMGRVEGEMAALQGRLDSTASARDEAERARVASETQSQRQLQEERQRYAQLQGQHQQEQQRRAQELAQANAAQARARVVAQREASINTALDGMHPSTRGFRGEGAEFFRNNPNANSWTKNHQHGYFTINL